MRRTHIDLSEVLGMIKWVEEREDVYVACQTPNGFGVLMADSGKLVIDGLDPFYAEEWAEEMTDEYYDQEGIPDQGWKAV